MQETLKNLLDGKITIEECENILKADNIRELDKNVKFDMNREDRTGFPEAVLSDGKDYEDLVSIANNYFDVVKKDSEASLLFTRLSKERFNRLNNDLINLKDEGFNLDYNSKAKILRINNYSVEKKINPDYGKIGIITAGTSDVPVAEEAKIIIQEGGCEVITSYDIGVAGIHRLFPQIAYMVEENVNSIIVCAGMEGALPSVVAGLVDIPIIAVPTSVGYGVGKDGRTALFAMLQSCSPGIAVVNIDNGFGAGVFALTIAKNQHK
ncbi:MAG: nickel pincer cofactor biosynthesis protein LarB [Methanobacteriaceae archaeon]|nr:nickel pincer cofactor biosynthesis protein LarB [Methanobacteriaceae archaeon]